MNTRLYNIAVGVLSASVLLVSACRNSHKGDEVQIPAVSVAYPVVDSVTVYKTYPGTLQAIREVDLVARVNGYLRRQNYNSGDYVKKGTVLFTIEDRNYADEVARCKLARHSQGQPRLCREKVCRHVGSAKGRRC